MKPTIRPRSHRSLTWTLTGLLATGALACGGGDDDDDGGDPTPANGRGSLTCRRWQTSICDFAERCGTLARATCENTATSITCKSDDEASRCATELDDAACTAPPSGCDSRDLADTSFAVAACEQFLSAVCDAEVRCNPSGSIDACVAAQRERIDCSLSVGVTLAFESCIEALDGLACGSSAPGVCMGVILQ